MLDVLLALGLALAPIHVDELVSPRAAQQSRILERYEYAAASCMHGRVNADLARGARQYDAIRQDILITCGRTFVAFAIQTGIERRAAERVMERRAAIAIDERDPAFGPLCHGAISDHGRCTGSAR